MDLYLTFGRISNQKNEPTFHVDMEEAISKHPNTTIVWCHIEDTRALDVDGLKDITVRMLSAYPNLYFDISWVVFEQIIAPKNIPDPAWIKIFEVFPDRFLVGSDKIGEFDDYVQTIRKYDVLFDALTPETARKLASENLFELLPDRKK